MIDKKQIVIDELRKFLKFFGYGQVEKHHEDSFAYTILKRLEDKDDTATK